MFPALKDKIFLITVPLFVLLISVFLTQSHDPWFLELSACFEKGVHVFSVTVSEWVLFAGSRRSSQTHCGWWAHCSSLVWMNQMRKYFLFFSQKKRNLLRLLCGANAFMTAYLASVLHILWFALMQRESDTWQSNVPRKVFSSCLYSKWLFYWHN